MKASVLIVDDDDALRRALTDRLEYWGHGATQVRSGEEAIAVAARKVFDVILVDLSMPGLSGLELLDRLREQGCSAEKVVLTAHASLSTVVDAMKRGADDFLTKPADFDILKAVIERSLEKRRLRRVNEILAGKAAEGSQLVTGRSEVMRRVLETALQAARSDATILLNGESGTGKQILAEAIHRNSLRDKAPFVYVNCVAISDELIESTLFGHEKGAFTGAVNRKEGRLEAASGGTAFLDEIGDVSAKLQAKLLHFLESGEFERVGGNVRIRVDCRVVAATNRDLQKEVRAGRFREDLFYRLNVIALRVPPLRERPEDIAALAEAFRERYARELKREGVRFHPRTLELLERCAWPGNVRQLKNAIERMVVLAPSDLLTPELLPPEVLDASDGGEASDLPYKEALLQFRRRLVWSALTKTGGNQTRAAEMLGLQRTYLNRLIRELGSPDSDSPEL